MLKQVETVAKAEVFEGAKHLKFYRKYEFELLELKLLDLKPLLIRY